MWALQKLLFILCFAVSSGEDLVKVFAYEGSDANVSCSYIEGYETYEKYLCTENCGDADVLIKTTEGQKNRYSITDNREKRIFTVTISSVGSSDAGNYWCGVTRNGKDIYTKVKLHVQPNECCESVRAFHMFEDNTASISCPYKPEFVNSTKYICKGAQPSTCRQQALITSDRKQNGQFTLSQTQNEFIMIITGVTKQDAGTYLCGIQRPNALDVFSRVELTITEWCCAIQHDLKGFVGQLVTLQCPYPSKHASNRKFLCKGDRRSDCQTVVSSQNESGLRFGLWDNTASSSFSVTITELEEGDAGTYWCGSDAQWNPGKYTQIQLSVVYPTITMDITQSTHSTDTVFVHIVLYVVPAFVLILVIVVASVVWYKCARSRAQGTRENKKTSQKEEIAVDQLYGNQEVVFSSKTNCSEKVDCYHGDEPSETLYSNYGDQPIYCNNY